MNIVIYFTLLAAVCIFAFVRGGREERLAALVCLAASVASFAIYLGVEGYEAVQPPIAAVDILALAAFIAISMKTARFWPLWVAGLQLTSATGHILKLAQPGLLPIAYATALASWSYLILIILAVGTWRAPKHTGSVTA
jgi:hypothetical protein